MQVTLSLVLTVNLFGTSHLTDPGSQGPFAAMSLKVLVRSASGKDIHLQGIKLPNFKTMSIPFLTIACLFPTRSSMLPSLLVDCRLFCWHDRQKPKNLRIKANKMLILLNHTSEVDLGIIRETQHLRSLHLKLSRNRVKRGAAQLVLRHPSWGIGQAQSYRKPARTTDNNIGHCPCQDSPSQMLILHFS